MIPPGVICGLAGAAVGLIRSPLWQPQRKIDASGADWDARCARDHSAEVFRRIDARDRSPARRRPLNGAGDVEAGGDRRPRLALPGDMNDEALEGWTEKRLDVSAMERLLARMLANQLVE